MTSSAVPFQSSFAIARKLGVSDDVFLDIGERVFLLLNFVAFACRIQSHLPKTPDIRFALILLSEIVPMAFVLFRPISSSMSKRGSDWFYALCGSLLPTFITMAPFNPLVPNSIWLTIFVWGICLQLLAKVFLGLSFGVVAANRGVKVGGPYSLIRHPIYAGYTLSHIGLILAMPSLPSLLLYVTALAFQIIRMGREELVLCKDAKYREFANRVKYRLLPGVY